MNQTPGGRSGDAPVTRTMNRIRLAHYRRVEELTTRPEGRIIEMVAVRREATGARTSG
jgi:hypothetical protein